MTEQDFQQWLVKRLDKLESAQREDFAKLADEVVETRHGIKRSIEQITVQVQGVEIRGQVAEAAIREINTWREEEGPLDRRLHRHSSRIGAIEAWRSTVKGALIVASLFGPLATGIAVGVALLVVKAITGDTSP